MKYQKNAKYDYEGNGISEENGYTKWFEWKKVSNPVRYAGVALVVLIFIAGRIFKEEMVSYGKLNVVIASLGALATLLVAVVPLHEIIHLLVMSKGKLDDKCIITAGGGAVSALYNGHLSRDRHIVCLILPCLVFAVIFTVAVILSSGLLRLYFVYLLVMSCVSSYTDLYMVVYTLRRVKKDEMIFGIYKKKK